MNVTVYMVLDQKKCLFWDRQTDDSKQTTFPENKRFMARQIVCIYLLSLSPYI